MASSSRSSESSHTSSSRGVWKPVFAVAWFVRTRPWLTGSASLCTLILGLVFFFGPDGSKVADSTDDDGDFVLLDEVGVYGSIKKPSSGLQITSEPDLLRPGHDGGYVFEATETGAVVPAGYTDDPTLTDQITVIRPEPANAQASQAAWLTGTIEEEPASQQYSNTAPTRHASR